MKEPMSVHDEILGLIRERGSLYNPKWDGPDDDWHAASDIGLRYYDGGWEFDHKALVAKLEKWATARLATAWEEGFQEGQTSPPDWAGRPITEGNPYQAKESG